MFWGDLTQGPVAALFSLGYNIAPLQGRDVGGDQRTPLRHPEFGQDERMFRIYFVDSVKSVEKFMAVRG